MTTKRSLIVAVALLVALAGCGSSSKSSSTTTTAAAGGGGSTTAAPAGGGTSGSAVQIKGFAFSPKTLKVKVGMKVTFTNADPTDHTATSMSGDPAAFDSGHLGKGKTFSYTFAKKGTYQYHCDIHSYMTGTVDVS